MKRALLVIMVGALYVLHQDFWFWRSVNPLVFGFIPIGLSYHACYTIATAFVMWLLVKHGWPSHLEEGRGDEETAGLGESESSNNVIPSPCPPVPPPDEGYKK